MKILKYLMFIILPALSVLFCLLFKVAQGERIEEIVGGLFLGIVLDFIYLIILLIIKRISKRKK